MAIDMGSPRDGSLRYFDAVFISPHKFIGGPGTPGVLAVRKELLTNRVPAVPGGGTVAYVSPDDHRYISDPAHREEGGTPAIIESIRAGLVFQLQQAVGFDADPGPRGRAAAPRADPTQRAPQHHHPRQPRRRAALDRLVRGPPGRALPAPQSRRRDPQRPVRHPVARRLLVRRPVRPPAARHRRRARSREFESEILRGCEGIKPGWVRVNFNYFISDATLDYIVVGDRARRRPRLGPHPRVPLRAVLGTVAPPRPVGRAAAAPGGAALRRRPDG